MILNRNLKNPTLANDYQIYFLLHLGRDNTILLVITLTLSNWVEAGTLTKYGVGGRIYFKSSEIEQILIKLKN